MKKKKTASLLKIGFIYLVSNIIVKGVFFLTTPLFTRIMTKEDFGVFNNVSSWASIISIITTLCLYSSINKAKYDFDKKINEFMSSITIFGTLFTLFMWLMIEINISFFESFFNMNKICIRSIMIYCLFAPSVQVLLAKYRMYNEYVKVIVLSWITLIASVLSSLLCTYLMDDKVLGRTIGTFGIVGIIDIVFFAIIVFKGKKVSVKMLKYACALSLPLIFHELSGVLLNSSDKIIINQLCGGEDAALYSVAYTISMILTVVLSSLNQAWVPWFFDKLKSADIKSIKDIIPKYIFVFSIFCVTIMLLGPELITLLGGKSYNDAVFVIPPVCFAIFLQFIYTLYVNIEFYLKKSIYISLATTLASIINIVLNYMLIPVFGFMAAAYTTVVGYLLIFVFHYIICQRTIYKNIYSLQYIINSIFIMFICMLIILKSYQILILRIVLLIIAIVFMINIAFKKSKELKNIFKRREGKV